MNAVSASMKVAVQAFTASMKENTELKSLELSEPEEQRSMAREPLEAKVTSASANISTSAGIAITPSNNSGSFSALTADEDVLQTHSEC